MATAATSSPNSRNVNISEMEADNQVRRYTPMDHMAQIEHQFDSDGQARSQAINSTSPTLDLLHPRRTPDLGLRMRSASNASDPFYGTSDPTDHTANVENEGIKRYSTKQSRRLPQWAWYIIIKVLGVKLNPIDKPILGSILHAVTIGAAALYVVTFVWYTVYDIVNEYTRSTVLTGTASIVVVIYWSSLGVYGNRLAAKLFACDTFVSSVRMHTKTLFKISAWGILTLVALLAIGLNNFDAVTTYTQDHCKNVSVNGAVCITMVVARCSYSVVCVIWNILVGLILLSICRTHTIGIRRFIRQLEMDGRFYESYKRQLYLQTAGATMTEGMKKLNSPETEDEYLWDEDISPLSDDYRAFPTQSAPTSLHGSPPGSPRHPPRTSFNILGTYPSTSFAPKDNPSPNPAVLNLHDDITFNNDDEPLIDLASDEAFSNKPGPSYRQEAGVGEEPQGPKQPHAPVIVVRQSTMKDGSEAASIGSASFEASKENVMTEADRQPWDRVDVEDTTNLLEVSRDKHNQDGGELAATGSSGPKRNPALIKADPPSQASRSSQHSTRAEPGSPRRHVSSTVTGGRSSVGSVGSQDNISVGPQVLSTDDIMLCYWRINCRLRASSVALQRWLVAWVVFIIVWSCSFLVSWISNIADLLSIAQFVLPILLLPIVCSAYGEVNNEGKRMLKCICPTEDRVTMMLLLNEQPLEMTVFSYPVNYSAIVTFIGAVLLAFCTKIVLEEIHI